MWITTFNSVEDVDCGHWDSARTRRRRRKPQIFTYLVTCHQRKMESCVFYCNACQYVSDAVSDGRPGRQRKSMICTHSEAHDADGGFVVHRNTTPQTSSNLFGWVEIHCQRFYFWCCEKRMTLGMRVAPTNAEPGERRQVSNISDAISVSGKGCPHHKYLLRNTAEAHRQFRLPLGRGRVAEWRLRHLTRKGLCLWVSALRLRSTALPYVTVVAAYTMAGRGLANDMGCDTDRVPLG